MAPISIVEALRFGWRHVRGNSRVIFSATLLLLVIELLQRLFFALYASDPYTAASVFLSALVLEFIFSAGFTIIILTAARGEAVLLRNIIPPTRLLWQNLAALAIATALVILAMLVPLALGTLAGLALLALHASGILAAVVFLAGILCGIAAGLYVGLRYAMARFVSVDGTYAVGEIIHRSATLSQGVKWQLLLFFAAILLINIIGILTIIGLLITLPVGLFAFAYLYLRLLERHPQK